MRFLLALFLISNLAFGVGSVTVTRNTRSYDKGGIGKATQIVNIDWTGDASDGSVPATLVPLYGYVAKVITNPGTTAPTANYDIALGDPEDTALDAADGNLTNRSATATEQRVLIIASGAIAVTPVFLAGSYSVAVTGNSVSSATGRIQVYLVDQP